MSLRKNLVRQRIVDSKEMDERQRRGLGGMGRAFFQRASLRCCRRSYRAVSEEREGAGEPMGWERVR